MKKLLTGFLIALVVFGGVAVFANAETGSSTASSAYASDGISLFQHDLFFGMRGNAEVSDLQQFLTDQGFYAGPVTGNFFLMTMQGVRAYQKAHGVLGSGYFGTKSRGVANGTLKDLIGTICKDNEKCDPTTLPASRLTITPTGKLQGAVNQPFSVAFKVTGGSDNSFQNYRIAAHDLPKWLTASQSPCTSAADGPRVCMQMLSTDTITLSGTPTEQGRFNVTISAYQMPVVINCFAAPCPAPEPARYGKATFTIVVTGTGTSQAPTITGVSGPSVLKVNQDGTWTISAKDPANGSLWYSVIWGDEVSRLGGGMMPVDSMMDERPFVQTATFTHTYAMNGNYTPRFRVMNQGGAVAETSLTVKVGTPTDSHPTISSIAPAEGVVGATVTLSGSGFRAGSAKPFVLFGGGVVQDVTVLSDTTLTFTVPDSITPACRLALPTPCMMMARLVTPGDYNVAVSVSGAVSNEVKFTVIPAVTPYSSGY